MRSSHAVRKMCAVLCLLLSRSWASVLYDPRTYNFGSNWATFVEKLSCNEGQESSLEVAVNVAYLRLLNFLTPLDQVQRLFGINDVHDSTVLHGLSFLDAGCGSGIHSAAAAYANASRVLSFDRQEGSLLATKVTQRMLRELLPNGTRWDAFLGDVLSSEDMEGVTADVVYSWGVLHHTGDLWTAIENVCKRVKPPEAGGGVFLLALYAREMVRDPDYWDDIKRLYVSTDDWGRGMMERDYAWWLLKDSVMSTGRNPFAMTFDATLQRGMNFWTDVKDWLGGYPTEFSEAADVARFVRQRCGLVPVRIQPSTVTEFLFVTDPSHFEAHALPIEQKSYTPGILQLRSKLVTDWHDEISRRKSHAYRLGRPFVRLHEPPNARSLCWVGEFPLDGRTLPMVRFDVLEDGEPFGFGVVTEIPGKRRTFNQLRALLEQEDGHRQNPTRSWQARFGSDGFLCERAGRYIREILWSDEFPDIPFAVFSTSDGSNPNTNGREYSVLLTEEDDEKEYEKVTAADLEFSRFNPSY